MRSTIQPGATPARRAAPALSDAPHDHALIDDPQRETRRA